MRTNKIYLYLVASLLLGCTSHRKSEPSTISPQIQYEFSGGAGHYNYAPSIIQDRYGIRYGFICENRDPFKIVDYVYLYKGKIPPPYNCSTTPPQRTDLSVCAK